MYVCVKKRQQEKEQERRITLKREREVERVRDGKIDRECVEERDRERGF